MLKKTHKSSQNKCERVCVRARAFSCNLSLRFDCVCGRIIVARLNLEMVKFYVRLETVLPP